MSTQPDPVREETGGGFREGEHLLKLWLDADRVVSELICVGRCLPPDDGPSDEPCWLRTWADNEDLTTHVEDLHELGMWRISAIFDGDCPTITLHEQSAAAPSVSQQETGEPPWSWRIIVCPTCWHVLTRQRPEDTPVCFGHGSEHQRAEGIEIEVVPAASAPSQQEGGDGVALIASERSRQVEREGYDPAHDDEHVGEELACAAVAYAWPLANADSSGRMIHRERLWPFEAESFKPLYAGDRIGELAKAGALIAAEIDRLRRAEESSDA